EVEELYRSSPAAMALYSPDLRFIRVNQKLADINNIPIKDHIGKKIEDIVPQLGDAVIAPVRQVFETGKPILDQEVVGYTAALPDQERVWIVDWYPLSMGEEIVAVGVNVRDITEYKNIQIELQRIMRELQHRVKNMLANVTSLINRAKRDERDPETVLSTLFDRIQALGKTHQLLASENWRSTNIREIIEPELTDVYGHDAITIQGPEIQCNSRATLALGMAIHELATNAAKYGALSTKEGHLHVSWVKIDEGNGEIFRLEWKESNCPISKAPENQGFGSTLIRSTISRTLAGDVDINWEQDGLQCVFNVPIERINKIDDDVSTHLF
ncbi:MAG: HWE histidine kinase domain-containing protein, partial [Pseudomonadota bacterium]